MRVIDLALFEDLARIASKEALPYFRKKIAVENKELDHFDPVTAADRNVEKAIRQAILSKYPDDGILGEEFESQNLGADYLWVIDPIDGTRSFITGTPIWGSLVGLSHKNRAFAGMMAQPYIGELFYTLGSGSFLVKYCDVQVSPQESSTNKTFLKQNDVQPLKTRQCQKLSEAVVFTTDPRLFKTASEKNIFSVIESHARLMRYSADCYAFSMLAAGLVDMVIEVGLKPYDIMALIPIIEQAGGVITCWDGSRPEKAGNVVAAATPDLHEQVLKLLSTHL